MSNEKASELLENAVISEYRHYQSNVTYNTILVWKIPDYEKLSSNVIYFQAYENARRKGTLRLFKHKNLLHLSVASPSIFKDMPAEFSIISETNHDESVTEQAKQISDGIYVGKFSNERFLLPDSSFLSNGTLTIVFKYVSYFFTQSREEDHDKPEILINADELCNDFKKMYLESLHPDFLIHVHDYTFKCHKLILFARSNFFAEFFHENKNEREYRIPIDVLPGIMHQVLLYIYCGELMEMDMTCMQYVYKVAEFLKISSLLKRCSEYMETAIDYNNIKEVCDYATKNHLKEMKNDIIRICAKKFPGYDIMNVFKQCHREYTRNDAGKTPEKSR